MRRPAHSAASMFRRAITLSRVSTSMHQAGAPEDAEVSLMAADRTSIVINRLRQGERRDVSRWDPGAKLSGGGERLRLSWPHGFSRARDRKSTRLNSSH